VSGVGRRKMAIADFCADALPFPRRQTRERRGERTAHRAHSAYRLQPHQCRRCSGDSLLYSTNIDPAHELRSHRRRVSASAHIGMHGCACSMRWSMQACIASRRKRKRTRGR
jgi:hypothetical protein